MRRIALGEAALGIAVLGFAALVGAGGVRSQSRAAPAADQTATSQAAFADVASVLTHPRCMNCHTLTDYPRQGDDRHRHIMNVRRGSDNHGLPGMTCATCHGRANNRASGVPGVDEDWHLAPLSMGWEGLSPRQLCETVKDPAKNGRRSGPKIIDHLNTHLVEWAWRPGQDVRGAERTQPPLSHAAFVAAAQRWLATGAACPPS